MCLTPDWEIYVWYKLQHKLAVSCEGFDSPSLKQARERSEHCLYLFWKGALKRLTSNTNSYVPKWTCVQPSLKTSRATKSGIINNSWPFLILKRDGKWIAFGAFCSLGGENCYSAEMLKRNGWGIKSNMSGIHNTLLYIKFCMLLQKEKIHQKLYYLSIIK